MRQRTMDEMITYFNQQVDQMDIDRKYKMALLGMITAIGYVNKKPERKTISPDLSAIRNWLGRWKDTDEFSVGYLRGMLDTLEAQHGHN